MEINVIFEALILKENKATNGGSEGRKQAVEMQ